uniref:Uncharacterized protein n=1 Tax=Rhizophora mucronata TaxID=61149 RepID=A0A2P2MF20_RHIMU
MLYCLHFDLNNPTKNAHTNTITCLSCIISSCHLILKKVPNIIISHSICLNNYTLNIMALARIVKDVNIA